MPWFGEGSSGGGVGATGGGGGEETEQLSARADGAARVHGDGVWSQRFSRFLVASMAAATTSNRSSLKASRPARVWGDAHRYAASPVASSGSAGARNCRACGARLMLEAPH